jgi:hypothetical protein
MAHSLQKINVNGWDKEMKILYDPIRPLKINAL